MKISGSTIQQLDKSKPRSKCRKWRLWATTDHGRKSKRFDGTYSQAQEALRAFVSDLEGFVPNSDTFEAYAASWALWREKSGEYAPGTVENDRREVNALCRTALSTVRVDEITPEMCRAELMWLKENPVRGVGELSNTTMNSIYICLNAILQQAVDDGRLAKNPMAKIRAPRPDTKEKEALAPDELMLFVNRLSELPLDGRSMALYFMSLLGLRRGEACAISDGDVRDGFAHVHASVKERNGRIDVPKSKASVRTLPVPPVLERKVDEWRVLRDRVGWHDSPTLCCNTQGGVLRPQLLQRWWSGDAAHLGVRDALGCSGMNLHQLRHSNLSMMARHMSPFDLQRYAGWSSIEPAKVYIHDDLDAVSRAVSDAWRGIGDELDAPKTHQYEKRPEA